MHFYNRLEEKLTEQSGQIEKRQKENLLREKLLCNYYFFFQILLFLSSFRVSDLFKYRDDKTSIMSCLFFSLKFMNRFRSFSVMYIIKQFLS